DKLDDFVDIGDRYGKADQHVGAVTRLAEQVLGAPRHHLFAKGDKGAQQVLQCHHQRTAAVERDYVRAERRLQRRKAIELVEDNVRHRLALKLDHDAVSLSVALVAQIREPVAFFFFSTPG